MKYNLGQTVYHSSVYNYREPLKVVGIREDMLELEGDYSGGTHNVSQRDWLPIEGVSRIYNYAYLKQCRQYALDVQALAIPVDRNHDNMTKTMFDLLDMVLTLTNKV